MVPTQYLEKFYAYERLKMIKFRDELNAEDEKELGEIEQEYFDNCYTADEKIRGIAAYNQLYRDIIHQSSGNGSTNNNCPSYVEILSSHIISLIKKPNGYSKIIQPDDPYLFDAHLLAIATILNDPISERIISDKFQIQYPLANFEKFQDLIKHTFSMWTLEKQIHENSEAFPLQSEMLLLKAYKFDPNSSLIVLPLDVIKFISKIQIVISQKFYEGRKKYKSSNVVKLRPCHCDAEEKAYLSRDQLINSTLKCMTNQLVAAPKFLFKNLNKFDFTSNLNSNALNKLYEAGKQKELQKDIDLKSLLKEIEILEKIPQVTEVKQVTVEKTEQKAIEKESSNCQIF